MENVNERKMDYPLLSWIVGILGSVLLLVLICFFNGRGAKATQFPSWTYSNETYTSNATYNDGKEYYLYKTSNTTEVSAYVNAYDNNGTFTMSVLVNWNYSTTHKIFAIYSDCTSTNPGRNYNGFTCNTVNVVSTLGNSVTAKTSVWVNIMAGTDAITIYKPYNDSVGANYLQAIPKETYQDGYTAGVSQGHTDVQNDPNTYGLYSQAQYNAASTANYNDGYSAGVSAVTNNPNNYNLYTSTQYNDYGTQQYNAGVTYADGRVNTHSSSYSAGSTHGSLLALNEASSSTHGSGTTYTSYSTANMQSEMNYSYNTGVTYADGRVNTTSASYTAGINAVTSNPNNYNLHTQLEVDQSYTNGFNYANSHVYESSASYTAGYSAGDTAGQNTGKLYTLNYIASTQYGNQYTYQSYTDNYANQLSTYIYYNGNNEGLLNRLNALSSHYGGTGTTYIGTYSGTDWNTEIDSIINTYYNEGQILSTNYINGQLYVLNRLSNNEIGGLDQTYTSYTDTDLNNEAIAIYDSGRLTGINQANSPRELTKFLPRMLAGVGGFIYPILTYEVFGISIMNFLILFLGLGLLFIILKFVL